MKAAVVAVNNLLAGTTLRDITPADVERAVAGARLRPSDRPAVVEQFREFYRTLLRHYLDDQSLSETEIADLAHLKMLLGMDDAQVANEHRAVGEAVYGAAFSKAISDGRLSAEERDFLTKLDTHLRLGDDVVHRLQQRIGQEFMQRFVDRAIEDRRLSADEDAELKAIAQSLNATVKFDERTSTTLDRYRLYWMIENSVVPSIRADVNLQRAERCYFATSAQWHEPRTVTTRVRYAGHTVRIRMTKGWSYRVGSFRPARETQDVLSHIDSGQLYLTNKRLIFNGAKRNTTIRLSKILGFNLYSDGVEIEKDAGKSPVFFFDKELELFAMLLNRALRDAS